MNYRHKDGDDCFFRQYSMNYSEREDVIKDIQDVLKGTANIRFAFLHGSFLLQETFKDIDVAVYLQDVSRPAALDICTGLSIELSRNCRVSVDVNSLNFASLGFCYYATQGRVLTYHDLEEVYRYKEDIWIKYMDFYPLLEENLADLLY